MFTTTKQLAQAIRDAQADPKIVPIHGPYHTILPDGDYGACVSGAIGIMAGMDIHEIWNSGDLESAIPALRLYANNPVTGIHTLVNDIIIALWESHKWSWERIANWLDEIDL